MTDALTNSVRQFTWFHSLGLHKVCLTRIWCTRVEAQQCNTRVVARVRARSNDRYKEMLHLRERTREHLVAYNVIASARWCIPSLSTLLLNGLFDIRADTSLDKLLRL